MQRLVPGVRVRLHLADAGDLVQAVDALPMGVPDHDALTLDLPQILVKPDRHETLLDVLGTPQGEFFLSYEGVEATSIVLSRTEMVCSPR